MRELLLSKAVLRLDEHLRVKSEMVGFNIRD